MATAALLSRWTPRVCRRRQQLVDVAARALSRDAFSEADLQVAAERLRTLQLGDAYPRNLFPDEMPQRQAAVLVPLCRYRGDPSVLFTLRSDKLSSHRGEVSFPGGKRDKEDRDLYHTALRETEEEIGIRPADVRLLGIHPALPNRQLTLAVYPVVGFLGEVDPAQLALNTSEVAEAFCIPLSLLRDPANLTWLSFRNTRLKIPVFKGGPHDVWGLTAFILHSVLLHVLADDPEANARLAAFNPPPLPTPPATPPSSL